VDLDVSGYYFWRVRREQHGEIYLLRKGFTESEASYAESTGDAGREFPTEGEDSQALH
jgi:hypothetical protein